MLASLGGGPLALAVAVWALAAAGCAAALAARRRRGAPGWRLARLALPWLAIPPVAMLAISQAMPVYNFRYVLFCVPALALLAGLGLAALGWVWRAGAAILILALAVPPQLTMRVPGTGLRQAASFLAAAERPGDAIVYPRTDIPPWYLAYPAGFTRLDNIGMARSPAASGRLYGVSVPLALLKQREQHARRIWVVQMGSWQNPAGYLSSGFRLRSAWQLDDGNLRIWLYQREPSAAPAGSAAHPRDQASGRNPCAPTCLDRYVISPRAPALVPRDNGYSARLKSHMPIISVGIPIRR
jgi:mannosyltransferase